jgi:hypothetical protein
MNLRQQKKNTYEGSLNFEKRKMLRRVRQQAFWALTSGSRSNAPTCLKNKTFDDIPFKAFDDIPFQCDHCQAGILC